MSEQSQTGKLIAVMAENLPEMTVNQRQRWIMDPVGMKALLAKMVEARFKDNGDGTITFVLPATDGTTGEQWIPRTEAKGNRAGDSAKQLLCSPAFKPTTGTVYRVMVLKGELFSDSDRSTQKIWAEAKKRKLPDLPAEAACLIREYFTDWELMAMGLWWIIVMHEPIKGSGGSPWLLGVSRSDGGRWLEGCWDFPPCIASRLGGGFAFGATPELGTGV
jgi:hypothetical protein